MKKKIIVLLITLILLAGCNKSKEKKAIPEIQEEPVISEQEIANKEMLNYLSENYGITKIEYTNFDAQSYALAAFYYNETKYCVKYDYETKKCETVDCNQYERLSID